MSTAVVREYQLKRTDFSPVSTIGELTLASKFLAYVLEDKTRAPTEVKVFGATAIPYGRYQIIITKSERFSKLTGKDVFLPLLVDVPGYAGVRIHSGNKPEDTEGCLLVGTAKSLDWVSGSHDALAKLLPMLRAQLTAGEKVFITISK